MGTVLTLETPDGDFISIECLSENAANEIELLLEARSNCKVRRPVQMREREEIAQAVREFHIERGCCDGTFLEPCTYKAERQAGPKRDLESERADYIAFQNAELS
jgi:hypothetical protein